MLGKTGTLIAYTIIRVPPADFSYQAPYAVGIVSLDDGSAVCVQIVDCAFESLAVGIRVKIVIRRTLRAESDDVVPYGIKGEIIE